MPVACLLAALAVALFLDPVAAEPDDDRAGVQRFIAAMTERHGFDPVALQALLDTARYRQAIVDAMNRPYEGKPWRDYRALFLTPERIDAGVAFWRDHAETLARAETAFGVAPEIVVAILGVETSYGRNLGAHRALDALATLSFSYPKRADFFRGELESFLLLSREERLDPGKILGSYAGALGKPQFISSSYRAYAVDFDGDGRRDLWQSDPDVIGSVANYFKLHGWRTGEPVAFPAELTAGLPDGVEIAEKTPLKPNRTAGDWRDAGIDWRASTAPSTPAALIRLAGPTDEYWIGLENFYVITRYNHSNLYAMAVLQLSEKIRARHAGER
ncbi:lytic murein transglycosylase B [Thiocystis violascens]|uniref:Lytic murein transglycosylase B n=1 Tax=Thiocystis violascens (strain ATCC 17096 / DSM 198 / 6111) TaxID=765911 RepID=I3YFA5_THIV6|nr:lytic murein transglycosylase B [Thiocystis violascens]AFL75673.1 lytic murein transglycosylase B [Thiocystis violascens DSM 198]